MQPNTMPTFIGNICGQGNTTGPAITKYGANQRNARTGLLQPAQKKRSRDYFSTNTTDTRESREYGEHYNDQFSYTSYHNCATNTGKDPEGDHWLPSKYNTQNMPIHGY